MCLLLLSTQFKDMPDMLALMMRHPSWPGAGTGRQAAAAAAPPAAAEPTAPAAAAAPAVRSGKPRAPYTEEEREVMRELNIRDLLYVSLYTHKSGDAPCWRVKLRAESLGSAHSEFLWWFGLQPPCRESCAVEVGVGLVHSLCVV